MLTKLDFLNQSSSPCKNCNFRHYACHDSCPNYRDWLQEGEVKFMEYWEKVKHDKVAIKRAMDNKEAYLKLRRRKK